MSSFARHPIVLLQATYGVALLAVALPLFQRLPSRASVTLAVVGTAVLIGLGLVGLALCVQGDRLCGMTVVGILTVPIMISAAALSLLWLERR
jgi:hypothetical protein